MGREQLSSCKGPEAEGRGWGGGEAREPVRGVSPVQRPLSQAWGGGRPSCQGGDGGGGRVGDMGSGWERNRWQTRRGARAALVLP